MFNDNGAEVCNDSDAEVTEVPSILVLFVYAAATILRKRYGTELETYLLCRTEDPEVTLANATTAQ